MRNRNHFRMGIIGIVVVLALLVVTLNASRIARMFGTHQISAVFAEAGGLSPGDEVRMAGTTVGSKDLFEMKMSLYGPPS